MLREALERRIRTLLEHTSDVITTGPDETAATPVELARRVEERIDLAITKLVLELPLRAAVRERPQLAERWPLVVCSAKPGSAEARTLRALTELEPGRTEASASEVDLVTEAYALIATIEHEVSMDRRRAAMAIDAGRTHHSFVGGLRDLPKDGVRKRGAKTLAVIDDGYAQLLAPEHGLVQLRFPIDGLNESILETLRDWRGPKGLRHWAALQRLLSVEGGRTGRVTWKLDEHLDAIGYAERSRENTDVRKDVADEVALLTKMELAVYDKNGRLRLRQALLTPLTKAERQIEGTKTWALEGLVLEVHPLLYNGVRDPKTGEIGTNWYPQTTALAKIDDVRFPYAIALGLVLAIRWRWAWADGQRHCTLSGRNLLRASGIRYESGRASRAWRSLAKTLHELKRIDALGHYEWVRNPEKLDGVCHLHPPAWAADRTLHAIPPIESFPARLPANGKELREWRRGKGWTQAKLAHELGVGIATVKRAEASDDATVGPAISKKWDLIAQG